MESNWLSLIPVLLAIVLAFTMRNVFLSLLAGIISAGIILDIRTSTNFVGLNSIYQVFQDDWAAKSILFCLMIGAFVYVIEVSGGVRGMVEYLTEKKSIVKSRLGAQLIAYLIGLVLFIDATSSIVISGVAARPLFDHFDISRKKLAYITDSTSSPVAWLIPFNAAGAFLIAMIGGQVSAGVVNLDPMSTIISAMRYQLYGIISIAVVAIVIFRDGRGETIKNRKTENVYKSSENDASDSDITPNAYNMLVPILILVTSIFSIMISTGDGSSGIYIGIIMTLIATGIYYILRGVTSIEDYFKWIVTGMSNYLGVTMILTLAFAFSSLVSRLGTGAFIASISAGMNPIFLPVMIFMVGAIMSFATGTSGGTVAILIPIALPMAMTLHVDIPIIIGAIISGGVFGDHCSPISDSTILSSMIAEIHVMEHVKNQMPYAVISATLSCIGFLLIGVIG